MSTADLAVAVTTVRAEETIHLVEHLLMLDPRPAAIAIVLQADEERGQAMSARLRALCRAERYSPLYFTHVNERGVSRGRNKAIELLPDDVTWVWIPNDTSRPPTEWGTLLRELDLIRPPTAAVTLGYSSESAVRRPAEASRALVGWELWRPIEPAVMWRLDAVRAMGGFDATIGTGSDGWAQSGDGTDLLCRFAAAGFSVRTLPFTVHGRSQHALVAAKDRRRKEFYYGVGFGCVARRHFSPIRSIIAVLTPLVRLLVGMPVETGSRPGLVLASCAGRATGLVLAEGVLRRRFRQQHWTA